MAQRELITFVDDIDGSEAVGTHRVMDRRGKVFELDLSEANYARLAQIWDQLEEMACKGRHVETIKGFGLRGMSANGSSAAPRASKDAAAVRAWAIENAKLLKAAGLPELSDRGRIPLAILNAYARRDETPSAPALKVAEAPKPMAPTPAPEATFTAPQTAQKAPAKRPASRTRKTPAPEAATIGGLIAVPMTDATARSKGRTAKRGNL